jgi:hypothetical protein
MENRDDEDLPKLTAQQENEFKKLKLSIEHGGISFDKMIQIYHQKLKVSS